VRYKILTPNPNYNGVTEGVAFANGVGYTDSEAIKNVLVNDYGYSYEELKVEAEEKPKQAPKGKASAK
jgi:hypothetical protein